MFTLKNAQMNFKSLIKLFCIFLNVLVVIAYLLTCLIPFLRADKYWYIAILGLIFPLLFFGVIIFLIVWLLVRSKWAFLSLIALLLSIQQLSVLYAINKKKVFNLDKPDGTLRVVSWNVASWDEKNKDKKEDITFQPAMMELIEKQNADVLCLQEFFESRDKKYYDKSIPDLEKIGFLYHYFLPSIRWANNPQGICILSKYPFIDTAQFSYGDNSLAGDNPKIEHLAYVDIKLKDQTIRIMTTHMQSVELDADDYAIRYPRELLYKLRTGYGYRSGQSIMIKQHISESPYPIIFCGDILDIPNSYAYFTIRGNMQDAFLKKGSGFGQTLRFISPTLRIDYIFADKKFKVEQFDRITVPYSDHYPIIADISLSQ